MRTRRLMILGALLLSAVAVYLFRHDLFRSEISSEADDLRLSGLTAEQSSIVKEFLRPRPSPAAGSPADREKLDFARSTVLDPAKWNQDHDRAITPQQRKLEQQSHFEILNPAAALEAKERAESAGQTEQREGPRKGVPVNPAALKSAF